MESSITLVFPDTPETRELLVLLADHLFSNLMISYEGIELNAAKQIVETLYSVHKE